MAFETNNKDQRRYSSSGCTPLPRGDSLGRILKKCSPKSYTVGNAGQSFSHIQTAPPPSEEKEPPDSRTPIFRKTSYATDVGNMTSEENAGCMANTLANNFDGSTFAAKARAAEFNASRAQQAVRKEAGRNLLEAITFKRGDREVDAAGYLVLKPRRSRGRSTKSGSLAELPPDENTRPSASRVESAQEPSSVPRQVSDRPQSSTTRTGSDSSKSGHSQSRPLEPSSSLFIPADPSSQFPSPQLTTPATTRQDRDHSIWDPSDSEDCNVFDCTEMPHKGSKKGGKKGVSPITPASASEGAASRKPTPRPSSSQNKKGDPSLIHPLPRKPSNPSTLNPNQQPFKPRFTPQNAQRAMAGITPSPHGGSALRRSGQRQMMDDPFNEHSHSHPHPHSSNFFNTNQMYDEQLSMHHQSGCSQRNQGSGYFQQSSQDARVACSHHSPHSGQTPYAQQSSQDARVSYAQPPTYAGQAPYTQRSIAQQTPHSGQGSYAQSSPFGQQSSYTHESPYSGHAAYAQQSPYSGHAAYAQQSPYDQQSSYAQHSAYDQSGHGKTAYAQHFGHDDHNPGYQQQDIDQHLVMNPHIAVRMPPPAVKGTPAYDSRIASLQSVANENEMRHFYNLDPQSQQDYLNAEFGPKQSVNTLVPNMDPAMKMTRDPRSQAKSRQSINLTTAQPRDPAPYTGFRTEASKAEMLRENLDKVVESSKAQSNLAGSTRTVLHDPFASRSTKESSSESTATTVKPAAASQEQTHKPTQSVAELGNVELPRQHLEMSYPTTSEGRANDDFFTGGYPFGPHHFGHRQGDFTTTGRDDYTQRAQTNITAPYQSMTDITGIEGHNRQQQKTSRFFPPKKGVKYTACGYRMPHGGASDFTTPYNVYSFDGPKHPTPAGEEHSQAVGNVMVRGMAEGVPKDGLKDHDELLLWFRSTESDRDLDSVARALEAGAAVVAVEALSTQFQTPPGKTFLKPIGHERASGSKSSAKLSSGSITTPKKDLMKNPSARDGIDLMAGVLANLRSYADGTAVGDHFTRWGRPSEWAIDHSRDGDKSFFGGGFEAAPQRVARDPRYQQTITHDGRSTYFEDPAAGKGKGRQW